MNWPVRWSWTSTHTEIGTNPDGSTYKVRVQGGPFYFNHFWGLEVYAGFRPTSPWKVGGNEGIFIWFKRFMQWIGWSNLGFALRRAK